MVYWYISLLIFLAGPPYSLVHVFVRFAFSSFSSARLFSPFRSDRQAISGTEGDEGAPGIHWQSQTADSRASAVRSLLSIPIHNQRHTIIGVAHFINKVSGATARREARPPHPLQGREADSVALDVTGFNWCLERPSGNLMQ